MLDLVEDVEKPGEPRYLREVDAILAGLKKLEGLYRERLKAKDVEIVRLREAVGQRDLELGRIEEEVAKLKGELAESHEKAQRAVSEVVSKLPERVVELLKGGYKVKCGRCGTDVTATLDDEQARQLLLGQPVQLLCSNPDCIDEFPWGRERHSNPLTFGLILRLKLFTLGLL
jgi:hypothetical protein